MKTSNCSPWVSGMAATLCCAALVGCGGSSDEDGTSSAATVSVGTITGFGSVIVNGTRFDDRNAMVTINERTATSAQLRVGMVVAVEGRVGDCPNADAALCEGVASRIRFRYDLEGPVTAVNRLTNTLQVMGRDVEVDDATVFDGTVAADLGGIAVGDTVAVSGLTERERIRARLLQRTGPFVNGTTPIMLHGRVANANAVQGTCTVDGVPVRFHSVPAAELPAGSIADGQYVEVQARTFGSGLMTADRIQLRDRIGYPDASRVEIEGLVSGFVSAARFVVDGQLVDASAAVFRNGGATNLGDGVPVEVEGTMSGGVLLASKLIFRQQPSAQIVAPIQGKDAASASLVVLGQGVATTPLTQFVDHTVAGAGRSGPMRTIGYADLALNDRIDVRAFKDAAGKLVAMRIERTEPDPLLIARGPVDARIPVMQLTLLGIGVDTGAATRYRDALGNLISGVAFYELVQVPPSLPTVVRAQGIASPASGSLIDATRTASTRGEVEIAQH